MKIVIVHGQSHEGSTCRAARMLADKLDGEVTEFFLPRDFGSFCLGCNTCFSDETMCPHYDGLKPINNALDNADVIILASPVYVYHTTGQMKAFLDHYGYRWMVHRPEETMFKKQAVCISTAAGGGMKSTNRDMADSLFFWGVARVYKYGVGIAAVSWDGVSERKKKKIDKDLSVLARRISGKAGRVKPSLKTRIWFYIMHFVQRRGFNDADARYWQEKGWTGKARPWKNKKEKKKVIPK